MDYQTTNTLTAAIKNARPDWSYGGIRHQLTILAQTWTGTEAQLAAHAMVVAANPAAQTPGALNVMMPPAAQATRPHEPEAKGPRCFICGQYRPQCEKLQDFEIAHGMGEPHGFETKEDAAAAQVPMPAQVRRDIAVILHTKNLNNALTDTPA